MPLLQSMEGKYYDVPDDQAASFEIPREKVKDMLSKAGPPPSQRGPGGGRPQGPAGGPPGGGSPVIIQVLPNGVHGPAQHGGPGPSGGKPPSAGGEDDEVDPYWVWYNWNYGPFWRNAWGNW